MEERPASGSTLASEAIRRGRPALSSSFRFHRPRGPLCGRGYCFACEIATAEGRRLACQTPADAGRRIRRPDPLRPLGRVAERFPPWFYEHRLLRPRPLRRLSLHALRFLSSAAPLAPQAAVRPIRRYEEVEVDVVVVGRAPAVEDALVVDADRARLALGVYPDRVLGVLADDRLLAVRFRRLVLGTGSYERLPPIPGNDLPGVVGLRAAERYAAAGALRPGLRVAAWTPRSEVARVERLAARHGPTVVWTGDRAPRAVTGRGRVEGLLTDGVTPCDLFVVGVEQPALELALQAGATARLTEGELPILVVDETPDWLEVVGGAARRTSGVPDVPASDAALACLCEDVRVGDLKACVAQGFDHVETVKRRTGAMTGPCQGKLCAPTVLATLRGLGLDATPSRARPLARPLALGELAAHA